MNIRSKHFIRLTENIIMDEEKKTAEAAEEIEEAGSGAESGAETPKEEASVEETDA